MLIGMSDVTLKRTDSDTQAPCSKQHFGYDIDLYYSAVFLVSMREFVPRFPKKVGVQLHL